MGTTDASGEDADEQLPRPTEPEQDPIELVSYEDDGDTVICDPSSPAAWITSDVAVPLEDRV